LDVYRVVSEVSLEVDDHVLWYKFAWLIVAKF